MIKKNRTMIERAQDIFKFLENNSNSFEGVLVPKSDFQDIGISPKAMDRWVELIEFIQSMSLLKTVKKGKRTYLGLRGNKFTAMMRKFYLNEEKSFEERKSALQLYFTTLHSLERLQGDDVNLKEIIDANWMVHKPTITRILEETREEDTK